MTATTPARPTVPPPRPIRERVRAVLTNRVLLVTAALWVLASLLVLPLAGPTLPFQRGPEPLPVAAELLTGQLNLLVALLIIGVVLGVTRRRPRVDLAARAPERRTALRETVALLAYAGAVLAGGAVLGDLAGDHPIGLHLPGTIHGLHGGHLTPGWVVLWAGYNLLFWAVVPYVLMRRRGYTTTQLSLRSADRRGDALLVVVVLVLESAIELGLVSGELLGLGAAQLAVGVPLALLLNLAGTVLPVMVFLYAILLPRLARLTGSVTGTVVLGGAAYALIHVTDSWVVYDGPAPGVLTVVFLFLQYFGPGLIKSVLTVRTGNAWVHVWAYHAVAPHVTLDTVTVLDSLRLR